MVRLAAESKGEKWIQYSTAWSYSFWLEYTGKWYFYHSTTWIVSVYMVHAVSNSWFLDQYQGDLSLPKGSPTVCNLSS